MGSGRHDVFVHGPGDHDFSEVRNVEEIGDSKLLSPREQTSARTQRPPRPMQRVPRLSTMSSCLLLDKATNVIRGVAVELDDMEWVHDFLSIGKFLNGCSLEPGETIHRDGFDAVTPVRKPVTRPLLEDLLRPSRHHVE